MLPKINRIKKKKDFEVIFKKGKIFRSNLFVFRFLNNNLDQNRFGFIVSQKVSKKATIRNKVRRRLADVIRTEKEKFKPGIDLAIIALSGIEKKEYSEIKENLNNSLIKAKIKNV